MSLISKANRSLRKVNYQDLLLKTILASALSLLLLLILYLFLPYASISLIITSFAILIFTSSLLIHPTAGLTTTIIALAFSTIIPRIFTLPIIIDLTNALFLLLIGIVTTLLTLHHTRVSQKTSLAAKQLNKLLDFSLHPVILKDQTGTIKFVSRSINDILGYPSRYFHGKDLSRFIHPEDLDKYHAFYRAVTSHPGTKQTVTFRVKNKAGEWLWLKNDAVNFLKTDYIHSVVSSLQDITRQKQLKAARLKSLKAEQSARKEAENAVRARDEFLSIASHELKTPLTTILLHLQRTIQNTRTQSLADFSGEKLVHSLNIAQKQSQRLTRMIQDLLNLSLISTGRIELHYQPAELGQVITNTLESLAEQIDRSESTINFTAPESVEGSWDIIRIEQVITNLLTNALKYGEGKPIFIDLSLNSDNAIISVTNHGQPISTDETDQIFDLFYRGQQSTPSKGLGVGLFISRSIIRSHGGDISCTSDVQHGTTFTITVPRFPKTHPPTQATTP